MRASLTIRIGVVLAASACQLEQPAEQAVTQPADGVATQEQALKGPNLGGANYLGVNLGGANAGGVNLGGANNAGINLGGANQLGVNLGGANLGGANLGGANLGGANLGGANLGGANLAGNNLGGANLGGANVSSGNLGGANTAAINLGGANLAGANLGGANLGGANLGGTNLGGANAAGANLGGANLGGANLGGANLGGANLAGPDLSGSNFSSVIVGANIHATSAAPVPTSALQMLPSGEDAWRGDPANNKNPCVVLGIGSTAFAKLVAANKPTTTGQSPYMYATIRRLPWGFTDVNQGTMKARAWEALIWGRATYCSFVVLSPYTGTDADPRGVAGFVKAVFRWTAHPSQMLITKYLANGDSGAAVTYPTLATDGYSSFSGMMNAGSFAQANPQRYVEGLVGFVSSTTNNTSVNVDFASSIYLNEDAFTVLANVDPSATKFYEGKWSTFTVDGITSVKHIQADAAYSHSTKNGVPDTALMTWSAYRAWKAGFIPSMPVARRCSTALAMQDAFLTPVPAGKCDDGVGLSSSVNWKTYLDPAIGPCGMKMASMFTLVGSPDTRWSTNLGAGAVSANSYMEGTHLCLGQTSTVRVMPVAETHIHSADFPFELGTTDWVVADHRYLKPASLNSDPSVSTQVVSPTQDDKVKIYNLGTPGVTGYPADSAFVDWYYTSTCTQTRPTAAQVRSQNACVPKFNGRVDPQHAQYRLFKNNAATAASVTWDIGTGEPTVATISSGPSMTLRYGAVRAGDTTLFRVQRVAGEGAVPSTATVGLFLATSADNNPIAIGPAWWIGNGTISAEAGGAGAFTYAFNVPSTVNAGTYQLRAFNNGVKFATSEFLLVTKPTSGAAPVVRAVISVPDVLEIDNACTNVGVSIENGEGYLGTKIGLTSASISGGQVDFTEQAGCSIPGGEDTPVMLEMRTRHTHNTMAIRPTAVGVVRISTVYETVNKPECQGTGVQRFFCPTVVTTYKDVTIVPAQRLLQLNGATAAAPGACVAQTVSRTSKTGAAVTGTAMTVQLRARAEQGAFYSNSTCTAAITSATIAAGASATPTFYFKKTASGPAVIHALSSSAVSASKAMD